MIELLMKTIPQIEKVEIKFFTQKAISDYSFNSMDSLSIFF